MSTWTSPVRRGPEINRSVSGKEYPCYAVRRGFAGRDRYPTERRISSNLASEIVKVKARVESQANVDIRPSITSKSPLNGVKP